MRVDLRLPVGVTKFLVPVVCTKEQFFGVWAKIAGAPNELTQARRQLACCVRVCVCVCVCARARRVCESVRLGRDRRRPQRAHPGAALAPSAPLGL